MNAVLKYDAARQAVAEAKSFDEVRDWVDKAAALAEYSRRARDRTMELDCMEIRERARRRRGELLADLKEQGELSRGRNVVDPRHLTLDGLGLTRDESSRDQKLARLDGDSFERLIARCRAYAEAHPEKHTLDVLKPPPEGLEAHTGSRLSGAESLDFFPTAPWATRSLMERVLPVLGFRPGGISVAWEPACGEGHMAEVLLEYIRSVHATDVYDYGYGKVADFFEQDDFCDWIITNPPFDGSGAGDEKAKATRFICRALDHADNVAMFLPLRYLEGLGRYGAIFQKRAPTLCAFFVERMPLHEGRWEPDGDTKTAYMWLVWIKGKTPRAPFWIPPGQRESLTHPDDRDRFTAHPVIKKVHELPAAPSSAAHRSSAPFASGEDREPACSAQPPHQKHAGSSSCDDEFLDVPMFLRRDVPRLAEDSSP